MRKVKLAWACLALALGCDDLRQKIDDDEEKTDASASAREKSDAGGSGDEEMSDEASDPSQPEDAGGSGNGSTGGDAGTAGDAGAANASASFSMKNVPANAALSAPGDLILSTAGCNATVEIDTTALKLRGCDRLDPKDISFTEITQPNTSLGTLSAALLVSKRFVVEQGMRITVVGNRPLIVLALQDALINGMLHASAMGGFARGGGFPVTEAGQNGLGPGGGGKPNGRSGAGGAGFCGRGGASTTVQGLSALGGKSYGNPENVPLIGGSSGGLNEWGGSAGGGAIQISARQRIDVGLLGALHVGGGGAGWSANGGGSGGAILLEAPSVRVLGHLAANGGGGSQPTSNDGAGGSDSASDDQPALGGRVPGLPLGGDGSAGDRIDGTSGGAPIDPTTNNLGAGGGGGAGRIRINVASGAKPDLTGAIISPSQTTPCFSVGTL